MRNLKRILSLAMASIMLVGMMVVGASAVDFPDSDKIEHTNAVNTMVALGIIKGKDDGNFDPEGIVTRAEMAKMICVAMNGGKDPNLSGGGLFPDTKGHWAAGYIDFCANRGYVAGDDKGNFNPNATVTGTEAAKMILLTLGYNAETEGFVNNAKWDININVLASTVGLYDNVAINSSEGLTRDNAAQMLYDGMQAKMVKYEMVGIINGNGVSQAVEITNPSKTILSDKFGMETKYAYMTGVSYNSDKKEYTYSMSTSATFGGKAIASEDALGITPKSSKDYSDLFGMKVKVLYKGDDKDKTVYGMYAADSSVVVEGVVGNIASVGAADTSIKVNDTSYKLTKTAADVKVYDFNTSTNSNLVGLAAKNDPYSFKLVDVDGDDKGDVMIVYPVVVGRVSFVGKDSITAGNVSYKFDDCDIYDGVKKDDYAVVTPAANTANDTAVIVKAETVTGDVGAVKSSDQYRVDGTWYTKEANASISIGVGDTVEMAVVNGYIYSAKITEGSAVLENVVYVVAVEAGKTPGTEVTSSLGGTYKGVEALIMFADGTKSTVKAMRVDAHKTNGTGDEVKVVPAPGLYTYKVNKDSVYELKAVKDVTTNESISGGSFYVSNAKNLPSSTTPGSATGKDESTSFAYVKDGSNGKLNGEFISDDAVIYLVTSKDGGSQKTVSGKDLKAMKSVGASATYLTKKISGLDTVVVAAILSTGEIPVSEANTGYGYVTESGYAEKNSDGDWTVKFTVWNGEEDVELTATDADNGDVSNPEFAKGAFVSYVNSTTSGEVTKVAAITGETAISGYDGDKNIAFTDVAGTKTPATFKDNDKSVVIFVNTADGVGVKGGTIETAQELDTGKFVMNAVVKITTGEVDVLFVDTANKLSGATYSIATPAQAGDFAAAGGVTALADNSTAATAKAGDTVELKFTTTGAVTAEKGVTIIATMTLADTTTKTVTTVLAKDAAAGNYSMTFKMPDQNITAIALSVAANA